MNRGWAVVEYKNLANLLIRTANDTFTTSNGALVTDDATSLTAGANGPVLLQDFHLIDKLAHFARERIPERVVHAKGAGAHGYLEITHDISHLTTAKFLNGIGKKRLLSAASPLLVVKLATLFSHSSSADTARDPRGFAIKFYTEEGNCDWVMINSPVFFIRDSIKFPDFNHTQKRDPRTNLKDPNAFWDFLSNNPESIHQVTILFTDRGTPASFRKMDGFYCHTLKFVDANGKFKYIKKGEYPEWTVSIQVMEPEDKDKVPFDIFEMTETWSKKQFPLHPVGRFVLNKNPGNYF
ncbi:hypothetical protein Unana1_01170 [Umbelopsis nana]